ncbi:hypothetical protein BDV97DRAFT_44721 [Delphinella strobiligena]|nr:hypothetical protein BDV97DRAFT_44721 [Delphinella strobiligena]
MAHPGNCEHRFKSIKSDTTIIMWNCSLCHSGPHWVIFECTKCKVKRCQRCTTKA